MNCASVAPELVEPMLFGGPDWPEKPLIDQAEGGTLCLEDIEALSPVGPGAAARRHQRQRHRNGAARHNIRIVAVSSRLGPGTPPPEVLRDDLYFRLAGLVIEAPPLRARGEDILTLFSHFTIQFAEEYGCEPPTLGAGDAANLVQAPWPGNIRQLINLAERAVLQARRGDNNISALLIDDGFQAPAFPLDAEKPLKEHVDAFEKMLIDHALRRNQGSVSAVMTELALPRRTLNEKMAKYGLSRQDYLCRRGRRESAGLTVSARRCRLPHCPRAAACRAAVARCGIRNAEGLFGGRLDRGARFDRPPDLREDFSQPGRRRDDADRRPADGIAERVPHVARDMEHAAGRKPRPGETLVRHDQRIGFAGQLNEGLGVGMAVDRDHRTRRDDPAHDARLTRAWRGDELDRRPHHVEQRRAIGVEYG